MNARSKYWCWTLNNYTIDEQTSIESTWTQATYIIYGKETGENATPHLQGYSEFSDRLRLTAVRKLLPRAHWEMRKGTAAEASDYCRKDGVVFEWGSISTITPGARTDLDTLYRDIRETPSIIAISENHFANWLRYERGIRSYILLHAEHRTWATEVYVLWGDTGTGKTRFVYESCATEPPYSYPGSGWFDGYDGHANVLFDDYTGSDFKIGYLLKLLDRYPMRVPIKGGWTNWIPKRIYITSNLDPQTWYSGAALEHQRALMRRLPNITHYSNELFH